MQAFVGLLVLTFILAVDAAASSRLVGGSVTPKVGKSRLIMGGVDVPNGKYPYQVSLWENAKVFFCGGSIINEYYILTAAHCIDKISPDELIVKAGTNKLNETGTWYKAEELIAHKGFPHSPTHDDIGLIRLCEKIVYSDKIQPIALPTKDINKAKNVVLSGWGASSFGGRETNSLQEIKVQLMDTKQCQRKSSMTRVTANQICTFTKQNEGVCHGDSGGPVVADGVEIGIVSRGKPWTKDHPDVHTRVYAYLDWIANNMNLS